MAGKKQREVPAVLVRTRGRFGTWRRKRKPGARIPEPLWGLAVKLARVHGVCRTASVLGLDYYSLKKRLAATAGVQQATNPAFMELPPLVALGQQCTIALDNGAGATMRVQLAGYDAADVAMLARSVWNGD